MSILSSHQNIATFLSFSIQMLLSHYLSHSITLTSIIEPISGSSTHSENQISKIFIASSSILDELVNLLN